MNFADTGLRGEEAAKRFCGELVEDVVSLHQSEREREKERKMINRETGGGRGTQAFSAAHAAVVMIIERRKQKQKSSAAFNFLPPSKQCTVMAHSHSSHKAYS